MQTTLLLILKQFAVMIAVIALYLLVARTRGMVFYQDAGVVLLIFLLAAMVTVGAIWGVFVQPWWVYALGWAVLGTLLLLAVFWLLEIIGPGTLTRLGPGGTAFLFPMLAFIFLFPLGGAAQFVLGLIRR